MQPDTLTTVFTQDSTLDGDGCDALSISSAHNLVTRGSTNSTYSAPSASLEEPSTIFIGHEVSKANRRNSVIIDKEIILDSDEVTKGDNQVMTKLTHDLDIVSKDEIRALLIRHCASILRSCYPSDLGSGGLEALISEMTTTLDMERFLNGEF